LKLAAPDKESDRVMHEPCYLLRPAAKRIRVILVGHGLVVYKYSVDA
jgi:hypothetical protein